MLNTRSTIKNGIAAATVTMGLFAAMSGPATSDEPEPTAAAATSIAAAEPEPTEPSQEPTTGPTPAAETPAAETPEAAATTAAPTAAPTSAAPTKAASKAAELAPIAGGKVLIFGDSTSAWFSDQPGSRSQGWWSKVARTAQLDPVLSAESGSGMWATGNKCGGTRFDARLSEIARVKPAAVIVATGRNDYHYCYRAPLRGYKNSSQATVEKAISNYMTKLERAAAAAGIPKERVYVTTPWGTDARSVHTWMWKAQKRQAELRGFTYVTVRFLDDQYTLDKNHPNAAGNTKFANDFLRASKIDR